MAQTTELNHVDDVREFYDALAPDYDSMTSFERRFIKERPFFRVLVENHGVKTGLDVGCGTGFHAFLLARLGVRMKAVDLSPAMVAATRKHAKELRLDVQAIQTDFRSLGEYVHSPMDGIFCMGNTLAHILSPIELNDVLRTFSSLLHPEGILFCQLMNFDKILQDQKKIQSVREAGNKIFVRYYDYCKEFIEFNLLTLTREKASVQDQIHSIRLRPVSASELQQSLHEAGFKTVRLFGGINLEEYAPASSSDLVVLASREKIPML